MTVTIDHGVGYVRTCIVDIVYGVAVRVYACHPVFASRYPHVAFVVFYAVADKSQRGAAPDGYRLKCQSTVVIT